ncbi:MAG TPA: Lrp/AsnC family transcriptional regulator [Nocardioidaceae bacterium]|nr:Lrp/AsnC family transcriptional regulator [Nocardioidaceae bacterium]
MDIAVINALQINPRASWSDVGPAIGVDASTAGRRWARLQAAGAAWVSCQPLLSPETASAFIEINAEPGHILDVARELAGDPQAMTIDVAAGARDLLVTLACGDAAQLAEYLVERLARVSRVSRVQSHILVRAYTDASRWRLRALTSPQQRRIQATLPPASTEGSVVTVERDLAIAAALSVDGRQSLAELAQAVGTSESTVRRRLNLLLASGTLRLRCEMARELTDWPVSEWFFVRVPSDKIDEAAHSLSTIPEVRAVMSAAGPFNLLVAVWLRGVADGQRLETLIMRKLPHVEIVDRSVVIRPFKLAGRMLDPRGFAVGVVPLRLTNLRD